MTLTMTQQQGVTLTGRHRTGPPCSVGRPTANCPAAGAPTVHAPGGRPAGRTPAALETKDDANRRQRAKQYWPIRRASSKRQLITIINHTKQDYAVAKIQLNHT